MNRRDGKVQKQKLEAVVREEAEYKQKNKEPKNIHEVLYKKAAAHMKNSWQENLGGGCGPVPDFCDDMREILIKK